MRCRAGILFYESYLMHKRIYCIELKRTIGGEGGVGTIGNEE